MARTKLDGGVGDRHSWSPSPICAHKLAYPTREVSFIRFQSSRSPTSDGNVIHCCADHSVYDPAAGARVVSGPAPQPLAAILLDYDADRDELAALGTVGAEQFDAFFRKYDFKLAMEYGAGKARLPVGATTVLRELRILQTDDRMQPPGARVFSRVSASPTQLRNSIPCAQEGIAA